MALELFSSQAAMSEAAANYLRAAATRAIAARGRFGLMLAGGTTPRALHHLLASRYADAPFWEGTEIFFGDERSVPPEHPESNYRMARETLLDQLTQRVARVHRIRGELDPAQAATEYDATIRGWCDEMDLVLLGVGADGHTASLFPGDRALDENDRLACAVEAPDTVAIRARVTITLPVLASAHAVMVLATGAAKGEAVRRSIAGDRALPLGRLGRDDLRWLLDAEAGAAVDSG